MHLNGLFHPACLARVTSWFAFVFVIFIGHENGDKQRPVKGRHVQRMLDETDPLELSTPKGRCSIVVWSLCINRNTEKHLFDRCEEFVHNLQHRKTSIHIYSIDVKGVYIICNTEKHLFNRC